MKLFMKSHYEKEVHEIDTTLGYQRLCMTCAGKMGGKPSDWARGSWKHDHCDVCDNKTEVTHHSEYIWRS
jgi:hypothetical protein